MLKVKVLSSVCAINLISDNSCAEGQLFYLFGNLAKHLMELEMSMLKLLTV